MSKSFLLLAVASLTCCTSSVSAGDLSKIDRTIGKEPAYQSKAPSYCLLVFGSEAKTRIWLVLDGDVLYIDRNGNGDLTEAGEKLQVAEGNVVIDDLTEIDGRTRHQHLKIVLGKGEKGKRKLEHVSVETLGKFKEYSFVHESASRPQDAQVIHFNGPLKFGLSGTIELVRGEPNKIGAMIGTPVVKPTRYAFHSIVDHSKGIPDDIHPWAEIEFPAKDADRKPFVIKLALRQRC
jgi:hypothetical protein